MEVWNNKERAFTEKVHILEGNMAEMRRTYEEQWGTGKSVLINETMKKAQSMHDRNVGEITQKHESIKHERDTYKQQYTDMAAEHKDVISMGQSVQVEMDRKEDEVAERARHDEKEKLKTKIEEMNMQIKQQDRALENKGRESESRDKYKEEDMGMEREITLFKTELDESRSTAYETNDMVIKQQEGSKEDRKHCERLQGTIDKIKDEPK